MNMGNGKWIWCEDQTPNTYCYARKKINIPTMAVRGDIRIVADSRYWLYVNGSYIGQGPTPFKRPYIYFDSYNITPYLQAAENVIAVLGNYHGVKHCTYTPGVPGILASVEIIDADEKNINIVTNESWKVLASEAYSKDVPRRTWATAWCEYYDARLEPTGWEGLDFDDSSWENGQEIEQGQVKLFPRIVAPLLECSEDPKAITNVWLTDSGVPDAPAKTAEQHANHNLIGLTARMDSEPLHPIMITEEADEYYTLPEGGVRPLVVKSSDKGLAITIDFGRELTGHVEIDIESIAGLVIDVCPAELLRDGRPWSYRKWGQYARRYITRDGRQQWRGFSFDGFRYLHIVFRGPHPELIIHHFGALRREADLPIRATFECDDPKVNRIWEISCNTARISSQEIHVDCPTREHTSAWGDAVWTGMWAAYLTGDISALRHLMLSAEYVQKPDGQMPCYAFSEVHGGPLFDFSLICVRGIWIYLQYSGDRGLAERLIPTGDRILDWYRREIGQTGLIETDFDGIHQAGNGTVFIDHPGLGWHNLPGAHPGIDRRGINAAIQFYFIQALDAQADVLEYVGNIDRAKFLRDEADTVRQKAENLFYNSSKGLYVDGYLDGKQLERISQQTNALAVASGVCPPERATKLLEQILDESNNNLCLAGTYFWTYISEALCKYDMYAQMWSNIVRLYDDMAERGATSWWETFLGDELDSLCHWWSDIPVYIILAHILGIKPAKPGFESIQISPRFDLVKNAKGSIPSPAGEISMEWILLKDGSVRLSVDMAADASATLDLPSGWKTVDGKDSLKIKARSRITLIAKAV